MTELLDQAVKTIRKLPPDVQDDFAYLLIQLAAEGEAVIPLTPEEYASFDLSLQQAARGEFATEDEIRGIWDRFAR